MGAKQQGAFLYPLSAERGRGAVSKKPEGSAKKDPLAEILTNPVFTVEGIRATREALLKGLEGDIVSTRPPPATRPDLNKLTRGGAEGSAALLTTTLFTGEDMAPGGMGGAMGGKTQEGTILGAGGPTRAPPGSQTALLNSAFCNSQAGQFMRELDFTWCGGLKRGDVDLFAKSLGDVEELLGTDCEY